MTVEAAAIVAPAGDPAANIDPVTSENTGEGDAASTAAEAAKKEAEKSAKTPEQREIERLRRGIDRRTRSNAELRAQLEQLTRTETSPHNEGASDSEPLSLTRAQLRELVKTEAQRLAPTIHQQASEAERRTSVVSSLEKSWGAEKFAELSSDLDDAFGGLELRRGVAKPSVEAIFEADDPRGVIEHLANPENSDEAERISKMSGIQAGKAIAKLEIQLEAAKKTKAAELKAQVSKAPAPLEPVRGEGGDTQAPDPSDTKKWIAWANEQERKGK